MYTFGKIYYFFNYELTKRMTKIFSFSLQIPRGFTTRTNRYALSGTEEKQK